MGRARTEDAVRQIYFVGGVALGLGLALFALQNGTPVAVQFLMWQVNGSLAAVVLGSAAAGALAALFFGLPPLIAARWKIRALERELAGSRTTTSPAGSMKPPEPPPPTGPTA